jgi:MerR family transcriptional regulator/heat shock protein HspR
MMTPERSARGVYVISVAAELAGMHPQTLRIYERRGLVGPARTDGGSRRYSDDDITLLRHIQELTAEGLNLEGVRRVLALESEVASLRAEVDRLRAEVDRVRAQAREEVEQTHRLYRRDIVPFGPRKLPARWRP